MIYQKKILKYGNSLALVIPYELISGLGWQRGDTIIFVPETKDRVTMRHVTDVEMLRLIAEQDKIIKA
jgi:antitoxin component of MazEF toxin-antitoxin module